MPSFVGQHKGKPFWILWHRDDGVAASSAVQCGNHLHFPPDKQSRQHLITKFLQTGHSLCCPTNCVKALKETQNTILKNYPPAPSFLDTSSETKGSIPYFTLDANFNTTNKLAINKINSQLEKRHNYTEIVYRQLFYENERRYIIGHIQHDGDQLLDDQRASTQQTNLTNLYSTHK